MEKIVFECENISVKMGGANLNQDEIRPASIKGVMRFWWRAINGDLSLIELKKQEDEIFGNTEKKSSFSIKIEDYEFKGKYIPKNHKFTIEFLLSNRCNFNVQRFFELVVILGLFGQKGKGKQKTQGSIKILKINNIDYKQTIDLDYIYALIQKFTSNYSKKRFKIENKEAKEKYPLVKDISISRDNQLFINFLHSNKLKIIKKNLGEYNNV